MSFKTQNRELAALLLPTDQEMESKQGDTIVYQNGTKERIINDGILEICSMEGCYFLSRYALRPCHHSFCIAHAFHILDKFTLGIGMPYEQVI